MKNGMKWLDVDGNEIEAHGGCRLVHDGKTYWYGENRTGDNFVSCYVQTSKGWKFLNNVLTLHSQTEKTRVHADLALRTKMASEDIFVPAIIERPKVLYNAKTGKFVMWMHYETGIDRKSGRCAVATCDTPDGDFVYHGSFNPMGNQSRDCTLYQENEKAYFISSARGNSDLYVYTLTEDYLNVCKLINVLFSNEYREAPAIIKTKGKYLLVSSGCTGWKSNQSTFSIGDRLDGEFTINRNLGDKTTYFSQSAFLYENARGEIVFFGDRWGGNDFIENNNFEYQKSGYCAYNLKFDGENAVLVYSEETFS